MNMITTRLQTEFVAACETLRRGSLTLRTPEGTVHHFGSGRPEAEIVLRDWSAVSAVAARGDIGFGEAYVEGLWDTPSIEAVVQLALVNFDDLTDWHEPGWFRRLGLRLVDRVARRNSRRGAARNISAHYDVGNEFYLQWLDPTMSYSSALFHEDDDLEAAQRRKNRRILSRLGNGEQVLEIGCGWGGFAEEAAMGGRDVTGITISAAQKGWADARLDGRAEIRLQDYRDTRGRWDNIVSIEMIEAVGERYWPTYFQTLKARLAEGGRAVVQAITVPDGNFAEYRATSDYIRHHTFPGGMLLSDGVISRQAAMAGLRVRDNFAFGSHYARTCRIWAASLRGSSERIAGFGYGRTFQRSWLYYLECCAAAFETGRCDVVQVELSHA